MNCNKQNANENVVLTIGVGHKVPGSSKSSEAMQEKKRTGQMALTKDGKLQKIMLCLRYISQIIIQEKKIIKILNKI